MRSWVFTDRKLLVNLYLPHATGYLSKELTDYFQWHDEILIDTYVLDMSATSRNSLVFSPGRQLYVQR
jgi:hypothetical protein